IALDAASFRLFSPLAALGEAILFLRDHRAISVRDCCASTCRRIRSISDALGLAVVGGGFERRMLAPRSRQALALLGFASELDTNAAGSRYHKVDLGSLSDGRRRKLQCDAGPHQDFSKQYVKVFDIANLQCKVMQSQVLFSVEFVVGGALHLP